MSKASKFAAFIITTIALALAGTGTAFASPTRVDPGRPTQPGTTITDQATTTAASPLWHLAIAALLATALTALAVIAVAALTRRHRHHHTSPQPI